MRSHNAFTLVELLLSLSVMAVIALAVAGVAHAITNGYLAGENYSDALQSARATMMRVQAAARKAKLITAYSSDSVVFWAGDTNGDGLINLDEIKTITFNRGAQEIREVRVDFTGVSNGAALNVNVPLANVTSAAGATAVQTANVHCTTTVLASGVTDFCVVVSPAPPLATQLNLQFTLDGGEQKLTLGSSAHLRADATAHVGLNGSTWVLSP